MRKFFRVIAVFALLPVLFAVFIVVKDCLRLSIGERSFGNQETQNRDSGFFEYKTIIANELSRKNTAVAIQGARVGIVSHHLPTALPLIADFYRELASSGGPRGTFIILGPDHRERCRSLISLTKRNYTTPFGGLAVNEDFVSKMESHGAIVNEQCFDDEHAIGVQTIFIKYFFPQAEIVPVLFSSATRESDISGLLEFLASLENDVTVIASVDFSHHHTYDEARLIDETSQRMIERGEWPLFGLERVDSPMALKLAMQLAGQWQTPDALILQRANSFEFNKNPQDTTGYISAIFTP
ncbi:MAG: AmmeMemoRadiSam system protein B [Candidatus Pacebacteria bacterium]|nr:AmmeMemoRadiSam system protein B [Candidatus Paceibacterota bacterium]